MVSVPGGGRKGRPRLAVLVYRRDMPARKRPPPEDAMTARRALLDGLARDADIFEVLSGLAPLHLEGLRERFLPKAAFRGRQNAKFQYAVLATAAVHGGTEPDLLDEVAWWQANDFWQYAMYAAVAYIRAAASRAGVPVRQACQDLDEHPGHRRHSAESGQLRAGSGARVRPRRSSGSAASLMLCGGMSMRVGQSLARAVCRRRVNTDPGVASEF
jgi:hypothetical protein